MDAHLQHDQQGLPPPSHHPPWHPSPPPPATAGTFLTQSQPFPTHYPPPYHQPPPLPHLHSVHPSYPNQHPPWPPAGDYPPATHYQHHSQPPPNFTSVAMPGLPPPPAYTPAGAPPYPTGPPRYPYPHSLPPQPVPPPLPGAAPHSFTPLQPPPNQVWGNTAWHQQQNWEQQDRNFAYKNEEDWAAKAKAWAAANSLSDNHPLQQYTPTGKTDEQSYASQDSFQLAAAVLPTENGKKYSGSQHLPISIHDHQNKHCNMQGSPSLILEPSSYASDARASYGSRFEGGIPGKEATASPHVNFGSSSFFEKEVSSSYSSISGKETGDQYEKLNVPVATSALYGEQYNPSSGGLNDQPLVFEQRYAFDHDQNQKINYGDATVAVSGTSYIDPAPSVHSWTPPIAFTQTPASGQQFDSSFGSTSSISGHPTPVFGRVPEPNFHPNVPPVGAPFVMGVGASIHGVTAFPEDANGVFSPVERPKKPSVPNWLREELIKKKASIASSVHEQVARSSHPLGTDDEDEKPFGKGDQADVKSMDSSRSTEDDGDDEDDVEVVRAAAINQEIKRVLTEILLKVTDELFEEIATRVLNEDDDLSVKVEGSIIANQTVPSPKSTTPKAAAKVMIPASHKTSEVRAIDKSSSFSTKGNILGLASYASDEDDDDDGGGDVKKEDSNTRSSLHIAGAIEKNTDLYKETKKDYSNDNEPSFSKGNIVHNAKDNSTSMSTLQKGKSNFKDTYPAVSGHHTDNVQDEINRQQTYETRGRLHAESELASCNTGSAGSGPNPSKSYRDDLGPENFDSNKRSGNYDTNEKNTRFDKNNFESTKKNEGSQSRVTRDVDDHVHTPKSSNASNFKSQKSEVRESMKQNHRENNNDDREARNEKKLRNKEDDARKKGYRNARDDQSGRGDRDTHRSKSRRSVSPVDRVKSSKEKNNQDSAANSAVSSDLRKRKSHSSRRSLSRSPSRSRRRPASRSPNTKASQRRHSPSSYSDKRRR